MILILTKKDFRSLISEFKQEDIMAAIDDLNTAASALKTQSQTVISGINALNQKVADLTAAVAASANVDPQIVADTQAINDVMASFKTALNL